MWNFHWQCVLQKVWLLQKKNNSHFVLASTLNHAASAKKRPFGERQHYHSQGRLAESRASTYHSRGGLAESRASLMWPRQHL